MMDEDNPMLERDVEHDATVDTCQPDAGTLSASSLMRRRQSDSAGLLR